MRIASVGHGLFALTMIGLGILGLTQGTFAPVWDPVPAWAPARGDLIYLCAMVSLASGAGLLWRRTAASAARLLLACLLLWLVVFRLPVFLHGITADGYWAACETGAMVAGAWILYDWFAGDWDRRHLGFATGGRGVRIARVLYGLALIPMGISHFTYLRHTAEMVPRWLPWHVFWAGFFGGAFMAAGVAIVAGVFARVAAALSVLEIALFLALVWAPVVAAGSASAFAWSETIVSWALMAAAWVVADSYRGEPWFAVGASRQQQAAQPL